MKKCILLIMVLVIGNMCFAQLYDKSDTIQEQTQVITVGNTSVATMYKGIVEMGYALGVGEYGMNNFKLNFINSISGNLFSFGLGIGLRRNYVKTEFYDNRKWPSVGDYTFPIFLDFRRNFSNKNISPYLALGIGGWFGILGFRAEVKGGFFINPSAGVRFKISDKSAIIASIVYEMQNMEFFDEIENYNHPSSSLPRENVGSVGINVGVSF
jgi:hypothetical protein